MVAQTVDDDDQVSLMTVTEQPACILNNNIVRLDTTFPYMHPVQRQDTHLHLGIFLSCAMYNFSTSKPFCLTFANGEKLPHGVTPRNRLEALMNNSYPGSEIRDVLESGHVGGASTHVGIGRGGCRILTPRPHRRQQ